MENALSTRRGRLQKLYTAPWFPFLVYGILMFGLHLFLKPMHDDIRYMQVLKNGTGNSIFEVFFNYLANRYRVWSSRQVIEGVLIFLAPFPFLWKVLDTLLWVSIAHMFSRFFNSERRAALNWFIVCAMLSFPLKSMSTAGWIATTTNYSWPLALGMFSLLPADNAIKGKKTGLPVYILAVLALLYAANLEQMCCVLLALFGLFLIYLYGRDKKIYKFIVLEILVCLGMLAFIATCPGNSRRYTEEIKNWFPTYPELSFLQRAELGYSSSLYKVVMESNPVFILFGFALAVAVFVNNRNVACRYIAAVPLAAGLVMGVFGEAALTVLPNLAGMRNQLTDTGTGFRLTNPLSWPPDAFLTAVLVCALLGIWIAFRKNRGKAFFLCYLLLAGLASRVMMGFSPTVWASNDRTFIFMYFAFIAVTIALFEKALRHGFNRKYQHLLQVGFAVQLILIAEQYMFYLTFFEK